MFDKMEHMNLQNYSSTSTQMIIEDISKINNSELFTPNSQENYLSLIHSKFKNISNESNSMKEAIFMISKYNEKNCRRKYNNWDHDEDKFLLEIVEGPFKNKWKKIAHLIGKNKTPRMCAYRVKKLLRKHSFNKKSEFERNNIFSRKIYNKNKRNLMKFSRKSNIKRFNHVTTNNNITPKENEINIEFGLNNRQYQSQELFDDHEISTDLQSRSSTLFAIENEQINQADYQDSILEYASENLDDFSSPKYLKNRLNRPEEQNELNKNDFKEAYHQVFSLNFDKRQDNDDLKFCLSNKQIENDNNKLKFIEPVSIDCIISKVNDLISKEDEITSLNEKLLNFLQIIINCSKSIKNPEEIRKSMVCQSRILEMMMSISSKKRRNSDNL